MNELLNFDIYAMTKPKNHQDLVSLAHEALNELAIVNEALDEILAMQAKAHQHA